MKKLLVVLAVLGLAAFAFSKFNSNQEEHEFGA